MANVKEVKDLTPSEALAEIKELVRTKITIQGSIEQMQQVLRENDQLFEIVEEALKV